MSLYYNLIFGILATEIALFTVLSLPLPLKFRGPLLLMVSKPFLLVQVQITIKTILVFILILFVDAFNKSYLINQQLKDLPLGAPYVDRSEIQAKRFYAQRNLYLTGFTLFFTLVTNRTYALVAELLEVKRTVRDGKTSGAGSLKEALEKEIKEATRQIAALKEQAAGLEKEYDGI